MGECKGLACGKWGEPLGDVCCKPWVSREFKVHLNLFFIEVNFGHSEYRSYRSLRHVGRPLGEEVSFASTDLQMDLF